MKRVIIKIFLLIMVLLVGLRAQSPDPMMNKTYFMTHKDEVKKELNSKKIDKALLSVGRIGGYTLTGFGVLLMVGSIEASSNITDDHVFFYFMDWSVRTLVFATGAGSVLAGLGTVALCNEGIVRSKYHIESLEIILKQIEPETLLHDKLSFRFSIPINLN